MLRAISHSTSWSVRAIQVSGSTPRPDSGMDWPTTYWLPSTGAPMVRSGGLSTTTTSMSVRVVAPRKSVADASSVWAPRLSSGPMFWPAGTVPSSPSTLLRHVIGRGRPRKSVAVAVRA